MVGIYPEMKNPVFMNKHVRWADGKKYEDKFIATLKKYGYGGEYMSPEWRAKPVFIQSFAPASLVRAAALTDSPLVFLIDDVTVRTEDTNQSYDEITSGEYMDYMKKYVVGIGPWKDTVVPPTSDNQLATPTDLVAMAHARGLQVHPYTYRNENKFLHLTSGRTRTPSTTTGSTASASTGSSLTFRRASAGSRSGQPRRKTEHNLDC